MFLWKILLFHSSKMSFLPDFGVAEIRPEFRMSLGTVLVITREWTTEEQRAPNCSLSARKFLGDTFQSVCIAICNSQLSALG